MYIFVYCNSRLLSPLPTNPLVWPIPGKMSLSSNSSSTSSLQGANHNNNNFIKSNLRSNSNSSIGLSSGYGSAMSSKKSSVASSNNGSLILEEVDASKSDLRSEHDLVPASLARPGDRVPVISPSYTKVRTSVSILIEQFEISNKVNFDLKSNN